MIKVEKLIKRNGKFGTFERREDPKETKKDKQKDMKPRIVVQGGSIKVYSIEGGKL